MNPQKESPGPASSSRPPLDDRDLVRAAEHLTNPRAAGDFKSVMGGAYGLPQDRFHRALTTARTQTEQERRAPSVGAPLPPSPQVPPDAATEQVRAQQERKLRFERANARINQLKTALHETEGTPEEKEARAEAEAREQMEDIRKEVEKQSGREMGLVQRELVRVAGDRAMNVLYNVAQSLADRVNGGGVEAYLIIMVTFFFAFGKDAADAALTTLTAGSGGLLTVACTIAGLLLGLVCGTIITFFWGMVDGGNWEGGAMRNSLLRQALQSNIMKKAGRQLAMALFDAVPGFNLLPIYLIFNTLSFIGWLQDRKDAEDELGETNEQMTMLSRDIRTQMDRAVN